MAENKRLVLNRLVVDELSGRSKLQSLLWEKGFTYGKVAAEVSKVHADGCWAEQVKATVYGTRPYPHIRAVIADLLGLPLSEVDAALDGTGEATAAEAA